MTINPYFGRVVPGIADSSKESAPPGVPTVQQTLQSDLLRANGNFGQGAAMRGNRLFVGEPRAVGAIFEVGEVHYYTRATETSAWVRQSGFFADTEGSGQLFGTAIDFDDNSLKIAVGSPNPSPGDVWMYDISGDVITFDQEINANTATDTGSNFGNDVAIKGSHLLIGAPNNPNGGTALGIIEYWEDVAGTWTFRSTLSSSTTTTNQQFGIGVAMSDSSTAFIARYVSSLVTAIERWTRSGTTWSFDSSFNLDYGQSSSAGIGMDSDGTRLIIGVRSNDDPSNNEGRVLIYDNLTGTLNLVYDQQDSPPVLEDEFGDGVTIDGSSFAVGSRLAERSAVNNAGKVTYWEF